MAKKATVLSEAGVRDAKALKHYHGRWIERMEMCRAIINRQEHLCEAIKTRLKPVIAAEVEHEVDNRAVVRVGKRIIDVQLVMSNRTAWQELAKALVKEEVIAMALPGFTSVVPSARAKVLGLVKELVAELKKEELASTTPAPAVMASTVKAHATALVW